MSYARRIRRGLLFILLFTIIGSGAGLLLRILLTRNLSIAEYGLFYAVYSFIFLFISFRDLGISSAFIRFFPQWIVEKKKLDISRAIQYALLVQLAYGLTFALIVWVFRVPIAARFGSADAMLVLLTLISLALLEPVVSMLANMLTGHQATGLSTSLNAARMALVVIFCASGFHFGLGVMSPVYAYVLSALVIIPVYFFLYKRYCFPELRIPVQGRWDGFIELLSYGKNFIIASVGALLFLYTDSLVLTYFKGVQAVGLYNAVIPISNIIVSAGALLLMIVTPMSSELYSSGKKNALLTGIRAIYKYFIICMLPFAAAIFLFPQEIIATIFGPRYVSAAPALQIICLGSMFYVFSSINFGILIGVGDADKQAKVITSVSVLNVILNVLLVPRLGIVGAALGTAIAYIVTVPISIYYMHRRFKVSPPVLSWLGALAITSVLVLLIEWLRAIIAWNNLYEVVALSAVFVVLYCTLLVVCRIITVEDVKLFSKFV